MHSNNRHYRLKHKIDVTSDISSGRAQTGAPILRAIVTAYLALSKLACKENIFMMIEIFLQIISYLITLDDKIPVDHTWLHHIDQVEDGERCLDGLVLEAVDADVLAPLGQSGVGPGDDLALHDGRLVGVELGQQGQGVGSHQLPDQSQGQNLVT